MDTKQELKPDLKEVYDRIMNTKVDNTPPQKKVQAPIPDEKEESKSQNPVPIAPTQQPEHNTSTLPPHQIPHLHSGSFAFSEKDNKLISQNAAASTFKKNSSKQLGKEIIIGLLVLFFIVYTLLCAVIIGVIKF